MILVTVSRINISSGILKKNCVPFTLFTLTNKKNCPELNSKITRAQRLAKLKISIKLHL